MITKKVLVADRIRRINGGFSFIPHRFLTGGFLAALDPSEALLYFLLVLAADRRGLSFYIQDLVWMKHEVVNRLETGVRELTSLAYALEQFVEPVCFDANYRHSATSRIASNFPWKSSLMSVKP